MKKSLYSVRDNITFDFEQPIMFSSDLDCLRAVSSQVSNEKIKFERGNVDFDPSVQHASRSLYLIGEFDVNTGEITSTSPHLLCVLSDAPALYQKLMVEFNPSEN